jgi:hypothetical protein
MPRKKDNKRFYLVVSARRKHNYGAFPFNPEGRIKAETFIRLLEQEYKEIFILAER